MHEPGCGGDAWCVRGGNWLAMAIAFPALPAPLIGFTLAGVGAAVLFPLAFSAAANLGQSGTALTLVTSSGYAGSIIGPAVIGAAADHAGLRWAISVPLVAAMVVMILACALRKSAMSANTATQFAPDSGSRSPSIIESSPVPLDDYIKQARNSNRHSCR